jgi:hypothetical protein
MCSGALASVYQSAQCCVSEYCVHCVNPNYHHRITGFVHFVHRTEL